MISKILFANFAQADLSDMLWERVHMVAQQVKCLSRDDPSFTDELKDAEAVVLRLGMSVDQSFLDAAPALRYIGMYGTGYGRIDIAAARERGVVVSNVADYSTQSVAEFVTGALLVYLRNLCKESHRASTGDFAETGFQGTELEALEIGVVGAGNIGSRVARLFRLGFGCRVRYWSRSRRSDLEESGIDYSELVDLLAKADVISIHVSANNDTVGLIDADAISRMKDGAILVNTAPNEVVDLGAVLRRCAQGSLTFVMDHADELEDGQAKALLETSNTVVYPPIGYATAQAGNKKADILIGNIEAFMAGSPRNHVNP